MIKIIRNSIKCLKCEDEIESRDVHDFRFCSCNSVAVDGGRDYLRRVGERDNYLETSITKEVRDSVKKKK